MCARLLDGDTYIETLEANVAQRLTWVQGRLAEIVAELQDSTPAPLLVALFMYACAGMMHHSDALVEFARRLAWLKMPAFSRLLVRAETLGNKRASYISALVMLQKDEERHIAIRKLLEAMGERSDRALRRHASAWSSRVDGYQEGHESSVYLYDVEEGANGSAPASDVTSPFEFAFAGGTLMRRTDKERVIGATFKSETVQRDGNPSHSVLPTLDALARNALARTCDLFQVRVPTAAAHIELGFLTSTQTLAEFDPLSRVHCLAPFVAHESKPELAMTADITVTAYQQQPQPPDIVASFLRLACLFLDVAIQGANATPAVQQILMLELLRLQRALGVRISAVIHAVDGGPR
jgi:hypothetical protein